MEDIFVAIFPMLLAVALFPLYLWRRRREVSQSHDEHEEAQVQQRKTVVRATGSRRMLRRQTSAASTSSAPPAVEGIIPTVLANESVWSIGSRKAANPAQAQKDLMGPRWKEDAAETKALANPVSRIVSQLQSSLIQSDSQGRIQSDHSILLEVDTEQTDLFNQVCFGVPIITAEKDKQRFELSMEEAFYLCFSLRCIKIVGEGNCIKNDEQLWRYMTSKRESFPDFFKAYSHLRMKNWVVRPGSQ